MEGSVSPDLIARGWLLDLRRKCYAELGGTPTPKEIWACVRRHVDTGVITDEYDSVTLSPDDEDKVRETAKETADMGVAVSTDEIDMKI
jgi:hypothetical protein